MRDRGRAARKRWHMGERQRANHPLWCREGNELSGLHRDRPDG